MKIRRPRGYRFTVGPVDVVETIGDVKKYIRDKIGIPVEDQIIEVYGEVLRDELEVQVYRLRPTTTLYVFRRMQISVKDATSKIITLDVEERDSIDTVKAKIQEKEGIPPDMQQLDLEGWFQLEGQNSLIDYDVQPHTQFRLRTKRKATSAAWPSGAKRKLQE